MATELVSLFPEIDAQSIAAARPRFYTLEVGRGVTVMEEGEQDAAGLFLLEGRVAIRTADFEIATIGPGGLIGEIGLFGGAMRIANVLAIAPCVFLVLDRKDYDALLESGNPVAYHVEKLALNQLASRLRDVDARIAALGSGGAPAVDVAESDGIPAPGECDALTILAANRLFEGAPIGALDDVAARTEPRVFEAGEALCREGTRGNDLFVLVKGAVEVVSDGETGKRESLGTLEPGDVFGMASVLQERPRMASCVAMGRVVALRMGGRECLGLVRQDSRSGSVLRTAMIRAMADQIAFANAQFATVSLQRKQKTVELLARLGIEAHGRHVTAPPAPPRA
jgi:CRP-like cAMP-binding protein